MTAVPGYVKTVATLGVLGLLLLFAVTKGLGAVTEPFPEKADPPVCVDTSLVDGDVLRPGAVTVSVVNAGTRTGLAGSTLSDLEDQGFDRGTVANQRDDTISTVQLWVSGGAPSPVVQMLRSYLSGEVEVLDKTGTSPAITVVVGDDFEGVKKGREQVEVGQPTTVCGPPDTVG